MAGGDPYTAAIGSELTLGSFEKDEDFHKTPDSCLRKAGRAVVDFRNRSFLWYSLL